MSLQVSAGESLVVLGKSGTGKSVLLKHVIGLLRPDEGRVYVSGTDFWAATARERDALRRHFGMSFQEGALFDSMTVGENIAFGIRRHMALTREKVAARVAECLEAVRLPGIERKRTSELSGGMRRRVGFARAVALKPEILLFDEPTTGLDPVTSDDLVRVIETLRRELKPAMITITHDLRVAFAIADRVALLDEGRLRVVLPPAEFERSDDPLAAAFVRGDASLAPEEGAR